MVIPHIEVREYTSLEKMNDSLLVIKADRVRRTYTDGSAWYAEIENRGL